MALEGGELEAAARLWRARGAREEVAAPSAALEGGEEAAARLLRVGRRRQRGYGGRGVGCSAVLEGGEEALVIVSRRDAFAGPFEKTQLSVVSAPRARTT